MARQADISAPAGFEDAVAWMGIIPQGHPELWQVTFTVGDRDASAATAEELGGTIVDREDDEWTKTATVRDPMGAQFVLSQFTPPKGSPS
jgi:predicted enzyme related to lactoylglutathione lyase